jgi:hypothetical protein
MSDPSNVIPFARRKVTVAIPPLVALLLRAEQLNEAPLTEAQVLAIRDVASCIEMDRADAEKLAEKRGYADIDIDDPWPAWCAIRPSLIGG